MNTWICLHTKLVVCLAFSLLFCQVAVGGQDAREVDRLKILSGQPVYYNRSLPTEFRTINAEWIREAADKHVRIDMSGAVVKGNLDLSYEQFNDEIKLLNCTFEGWVDLSNSIFVKAAYFGGIFELGVTFEGATFEKAVHFYDLTARAVDFTNARINGLFEANNAKFQQFATFRGTDFEGDATFVAATFQEGAVFDRSEFHARAGFEQSSFGKYVSFEAVCFLGHVQFGGLPQDRKLNAHFRDRSYFRFARFEQETDLRGVSFDGDVDFYGIQTSAPVYFNGAIFKKAASFARAAFGSDVSFDSVSFNATTDFSMAQFVGIANFRQAQFEKRAYFTDSRFMGFSAFGGANFHGGADFIYTQFADAALFGSANTGPLQFGDKADFHGAVFQRQVALQNVVFLKDASFVGSVFNSEFKSTNATFSQAADFSRAQFQGPTYFGVSNSSENHIKKADVSFSNAVFDYSRSDKDTHFELATFAGRLSLVGAHFQSLSFAPDGQVTRSPQFSDSIDFRGCVYDRIQGNWKSLLQFPDGRARQDPYDRQPYLQMEQNLRATGSQEDADAVYVERMNREMDTFPWSTVWYYELFKHFLNFGVGPRPWVIAIFLILIGAILFRFLPKSLARTEPEADQVASTASLGQGIWLSLQSFLPLELPVKCPWKPQARSAIWVGNLLRVFGWILIPILILVVTGLIHRNP